MVVLMVVMMIDRYFNYLLFPESGAAICGNQVVEGKEECDCGFAEDCKDDNCCNHAGSKNRCKLKTNATCRCVNQ